MRRSYVAARERVAHPESERGVALLLGILFTIIVSGLVVSGALVLRAQRTQSETNFRLHSQTMQFARAGLIEALGWFRKSTVQPVTAFEPQLVPAANPPLIETLDPEVGIVREFQIAGPVWGRYEIWKQWEADPDPQRLVWRRKVQVEDITRRAASSGTGNVWRIRAVSYVYRRVDPNKAYDELPNHVLGTDIVGTELRRMSLAAPGQAAVCVRDPAITTIVNKVNIRGGVGAGIFHAAGPGAVTTFGNPNIEGSPGISSSASYDDSVQAVFGVTEKELRVLADVRLTSAVNFPSPVVPNQLYHIQVPRLDITAQRPLVGSAVVFVKGDVDFEYGNRSFFSGMLYVDGDLTMRGPLEFNGTIICTGTVRIEGQTDWIDINFDDKSINRLRLAIGQYRLSSAIRRALSAE